MYLTLIFFLIIVLPNFILIKKIKEKSPPYRAVLEGIMLAAVGTVAVFIAASASGSGLGDQMKSTIDQVASSLVDDPSITKLLSGMDTAQREAYIKETYNAGADLLPATFLIFSAVISYCEYIILSRRMSRKDSSVLLMPKLRYFSLPVGTVWGCLMIYFIAWALAKTKIMPGDLLYTNVSALINGVFCLMGIAVLLFICYKKNVPKVIGVIIIIVLLVTGIGKLVLMALGVFDMILGIRAKMK